MHDIGKIAVPDAILLKPGPLSAAERREMERHAARGAAILGNSTSDLLRLAAEIALTHHERWDGTGYPRGLMGEAIPLPGRIMAVADVFDALTSKRPYKQPWSPEAARDHLLTQSGAHFDPACVRAFVSC
jgi:putative two-component system response regulator